MMKFVSIGISCDSLGLPSHERADQLPEGSEDEEGCCWEGSDLPGLPSHAEHTQAWDTRCYQVQWLKEYIFTSIF